MKKKLCLILSAILCFLSLSVAYAEDATTEEAVSGEVVISEEEYWESLSFSAKTAFELGLIKRDYDDLLDLQSILSRAEFVQLLCNVLQYGAEAEVEGAVTESTGFIDVGQYHYAAKEIGWLKSSGIISGYDDGTFKPEQEITVEEAVIMFMNAAGYSNIAKFLNGEIISLAQKTNIFRSLNVNLKAPLTRDVAAGLLGNFIFVNTVSFDGKNINYNGEMILEKYMDMKYIDGILEATNGISIYGDVVSVVEAVIDRNKFNIMNDKNYEEYLGYNVRAFYNYDGEILTVLPKNNNILKLEAKDIIKFENNKYYYYENDWEKSVGVIPEKDILLNGEYTSDTTQMKPECGYVLLIDNDDNGKYDIVRIENYVTYIVETADSNTKTIIMKNKDSLNKQIVYNLKNWEEHEVIDKEGYSLTIAALRENTVVNIAEGTDRIKFYISDETMEGTINRFSPDENIVTINKVDYPIIDSPYMGRWNGTLGLTLTVHFDSFGNVAAFSGVKAGEWKYGYIIRHGIDEETDLMFIKFLDQDGEFKRLLCNEKVYIDSDRFYDAQSAINALKSAYSNFVETAPGQEINTVEDKKYYERLTTRIMRYCINNSGEIKNIDTPVMKSMFETPDTVINSSDCLLITAKGRLHKSDVFGTMLRAPYGTGNCEVLGEIMTNNKSIVFSVPFDISQLSYEENYKISNSLSNIGLINDGYYASSGYTITDGSLTSDVVVIAKQTGESSSYSDVAMFDMITYELDKHDVAVGILHGIFDGAKASYPISDKNIFNPKNLKRGDIILYSLDDGEIIIESIAYRGSNHSGILATTNKYLTRPGEQHYFAKGRVILARIDRIDDTTVVLKYDSNQELMPGLGDFYMYDYSEGEISKVSIDKIRTSSVYDNNADYVIVHQVAGQISDKFLIRW